MDAGQTIPAGQPMLLVRVLNRSVAPSTKSADPEIVELPNMADAKKYGQLRRLVIPSASIEPGFKVLLYPYRQGAALPQTAWNARRNALQVAWAGQNDTVQFVSKPDGSTRIAVTR
jgi:hypothetical protein